MPSSFVTSSTGACAAAAVESMRADHGDREALATARTTLLTAKVCGILNTEYSHSSHANIKLRSYISIEVYQI